MVETNPKSEVVASTAEAVPFKSELQQISQKFLSEVIVFTLASKERSPEDFIRHFSPMKIMSEALKGEAKKRAGILVPSGIASEKVVMSAKKTADSCGTDLEIALEEGVVEPADIVSLFPADDRVRHLKATELWQFNTEGVYWNTPASDKEKHTRAKSLLVFHLENALKHKLISERDIVEGIKVLRLTQCLPEEMRVKVLEATFASAQEKKAFTEADFVKLVGIVLIVDCVPSPEIWEGVIATMAIKHKYADEPKNDEPPKTVAATPGSKTPPPLPPPKSGEADELLSDDDIEVAASKRSGVPSPKG